MYTKFFGFTDKPFNVTPDPRFLYLSPSHQEALASMIYGIRERRGFVSIIGEVGTGKTTLLHTLFNELDKDIKTVFIFNTRINFNQLLQNILIELELIPKSNNKTELLQQLNSFLIEKLSLGENVALIIDEAQNLPSTVLEELRMLSNLETDRDKLLQIILVGQPELDFKLRSPNLRQLKQRIGINCYITPLNYDESINYITHRLNIVDADNSVFTPDALKLICEFSRGIPRLINIICDNTLVIGYGKGTLIIDHTIAKDVIADFDGNRVITILEKKGNDSSQKIKKRNNKLLVSSFTTLLILFFLALFSFFFKPTLFNFLKYKSFSPTQLQTTPKETIAEEDTVLSSPERIASDINSSPLDDTQTNLIHDSNKLQNTVIVKEGDILSKILHTEYSILNDNIYEIVKSANPEIQNIDQILVGQKIILPRLDINSQIVELAPNIYSFHIASFRSYSSTKKYLNKLISNNYPIYITPVKGIGEKTWYRIMIGQFSNRNDALIFAKTFKNNNLGR